MNKRTAQKAIWCGIFLCFLTFTSGIGTGTARADDQPITTDDQGQGQYDAGPDQTGVDTDQQPGVARVSIVSGEVNLKRGDSGDTVSAAVNAPLEVGDYISTGNSARAEIQFDNSNVVRIGNDTDLRFTKLDPNDHSLQLAQGTVELRVFSMNDANPTIETPSVTVRPDDPGRYVVHVTSDGDTQITVRSGQADVADDQGSQTLTPGNTMVATGDPSGASFQYISTVADTDFDNWTDGLDAQVANNPVPSYVNDNVVGADQLDQYGQWVDNSQYGEVWQPSDVGADWSPYSAGNWVWEPYYGWTWVSYEPWGWAPYHYGNWFYAANAGWCWYPGPAFERPIYRPAMVAFFGFGNGYFDASLGFGDFGDIGWVPVGPFEPFYPWWGGNSIVVVNNINIVNVYRNFGRGAVVVGARNFANGDFSHHVQIQPRDIAHARIVRGGLPIVPTPRNFVVARNGRVVTGGTQPERGFDHFSAPQHIASFQDERNHVELAAKQFAGSPRQDTAPGAGFNQPAPRGFTTQTRNVPTQLGSTHTVNTDPWTRFGMQRQNVGGSVGSARPIQQTMPVEPRGQTGNGGDVWSRFGSRQPAPRVQQMPERTAPVIQHGVQGNGAWSRFSSEQPRQQFQSQPAPRYGNPNPGYQRGFNSAPAPRSYSNYRPNAYPMPGGNGGYRPYSYQRPSGGNGAWNRLPAGGYQMRTAPRPQYNQYNVGRPMPSAPQRYGGGRPSGSQAPQKRHPN
jgi:hypothetical protein